MCRRDGQRESSRTSTDIGIETAEMTGKRGQGEANYGGNCAQWQWHSGGWQMPNQ